MQLDTGTDVTTIDTQAWAWIGFPELQPYKVSCSNVSGHPLRIKGFFDASLRYKNCSTIAPIIVLDRPEIALVSAQVIDELRLISYDTGLSDTQQSINMVTINELQKQFTELFSDSTGECTKTTIHLRLKPDAHPVHVPRRPIALALEEPINAELDRLVKQGILTPVDSSDWAAPIVVARKANGKIRICADYFTGLNDALETEDHLIPSVEDNMTQLQGKKSIKPDPARFRSIQAMRVPQNTKEVRSFLGLVTYYGKFVQNFHRLKAPLEALLKKDVPFAWTSKRQRAFEDIKRVLLGPLLLTHYDPKQTLIVAADASSVGIGGALLQRAPDGKVKAVFHMSKALTETQQKYSQIEKEALALITAVERFRKFAYGRHFVLQTDHRPLLALFRTSNTKGLDTRTANRSKRWALRLIGYDFEIEYVNTEKFGQADALSRLIQEARQDAIDPDLEELQQATVRDSILTKVTDCLRTRWLKPDAIDKDLLPYYRRREYLAIVDGILVSDEKLVIPKRLHSVVLNRLHIAHPGIRRMVQLARRYFYWPAMHDDIEKYIKKCDHCMQTAANPVKEPLHPWPNPEKPWCRLHIDFAGPLQGQWALVIVDSYSKFVDASWFSTITAAATCRYLRKLFSRYGPPEVLVSDNGTQFTSEEFAQLCAEFNILHLRSLLGHPQSNGQAERMVRTLKSSIHVTSPSTPLDIFRPITKPKLALTSKQQRMKQQFDSHHGVKSRSFVPGQAVVIQLSNGQRVPGEID
ncbi:hypothetical protein DMN91_008545 [Ooceraea biroi]|uniref:RNA-directed DNA polymerase n=3 Tax=Ooceraea biroi TaxID=2015173 RepID=A0A3L8DI34_OOCBI|nr:hypothetical protein DMN91_008545 [Ooceraea biroi]